MGQELQIPDNFRGQAPAQAFATLNPYDDNLAAGIGQAYGVIGYKGKVWSLRYRGERKNILRPDDGTPSSYLDVIILGQAKQKSKSYYKEYVQGQEGERPQCASIDGIKPDADVVAKQCDTCALCPRNEWKTDPKTGRKGRECTDYKRLAVLILPTQTKPILGEALVEPVFLRVPPDSLTSLAVMGDTMAQQGFHYSTYITRITFDPNKAHPCMVFRPLQRLTDQEGPVILKARSDAMVGRITGGEPDIHEVNPVQIAPPGAAPTGLVAGPLPSTVVPSTATPPTSSVTPTAVVPPATPASAPATSASPSTTTGLVDTGFGTAQSAPTTLPPPSALQPVQDAGAPEESDAALDARIAALMGGK